ncbi:scavenger receptor cysteine-rich type 1 protein M160-like [Ylistrum balloti]|uniref:scavenger receptor cysteine-rich type 1 protein M160-like n=1 Tax=Ylistrum balloti TaxID=509963 RepID=UPI0029059AF1|nr:scavenger receptor cysteine-rich type 1 protein M160-like [Ylistrum balloti]
MDDMYQPMDDQQPLPRVVNITCQTPGVTVAPAINIRIVPIGSELPPFFEGILEVNRTGSWQILCTWGFRDVEANIACKEIGFVGGIALPRAAYGPYSGAYTTPFRGCNGEESSLLDCRFEGQESENICRSQNTYYASLHCYDDVPVQQGPSVKLTNEYHGKVAYSPSGVWGQVCLTYWNDEVASVVCRELGYNGGVATRADSTNGFPFTLTKMHCHGNESRLIDCQHIVDVCYDTRHRAAAVCYRSGISVRLEDGDGRSGRIEIKYDGVDGFLAFCGLSESGAADSKTPSYICQTLGYATGSFIGNTASQGVIYWAIEECYETDNSIFMCRNKGWLPDKMSNCYADKNIVAVSCDIGVNLLGGIDTINVTMGMVEMFTSKKWTTVCAHDFGQTEATVVCRQLGFAEAQVLLPDMFGRFRFVTFATELACIGNETSLNDCTHTTGTCLFSSKASVLCSKGRVSTDFKAYLSHDSYGTVLIEKYGLNGTVCRYGWDDHDSQVLCKQLGYHGGVALGTKAVTTRYNPIWLSAVNCTGQENTILDCFSDLSIDPKCGKQLSAAGSLCYDDIEPSVNLVGGSESGHGTAVVTYAGISGTICDNGWSGNDANVLCRQLGFPYGIPTIKSLHGKVTGPVFLDGVKCDGTESTILSCPNMGWNVSSVHCDAHNDDAGVTCFSWAKLHISRYYGAVMFWNEELDTYGLVCDDGHFGNVAAEVFCKEQGLQYSVAVGCSTFGDFDSPYTLSSVDCDGSETKLIESKLKLQNGDHGYVEVNHLYQYGYICSEGFDDVDATVMCKMTGYVYGTAYRHYIHNQKLGSIHRDKFRWLSNLSCNSTANTLDDCDPRWGETCPCDHRTIAGVFCLSQPASAMVELENGTAMEGRVLVKVNVDTTGLVCGDYFSHNEADVICRQLGYRSGISLDSGSHGNAVGNYFLESMTCNGNETSFLECALEPHYNTANCRSGAAAVKCYQNVRLTGVLSKPYFGRVELHNGEEWEAVCDENFDDTDARVVCESLGYVTGRSQCCFNFGPQPINVKIQVINMTCDGNEKRVQDCSYDTELTCPSNRYASAFCLTKTTVEDIAVRLPGNSFYGPVEVRRYGMWGSICASGWDDHDADVTCRTLGYRTGKAVRNLVDRDDVIILGNVNCRGVEKHFGDCILDPFGTDTGCYDRYALAGVICLNTSDQISFETRGTGKSSAIYISADTNSMYIAYSDFDDVTASVVCKDMDTTYVGGSAMGFISHIPSVTKFRCKGNEQSALDCIGHWNSGITETMTIASVNCHRGVKLVSGETHFGIVEVYRRGTWGTICSGTFSESEAGVVCRNLGFDDGISLCCSPFGKAKSPVLVSFLQCSGTESDLRECLATFVHPNNVHDDLCTSTDDYASVVCYNGARPQDYKLSLPKPSLGHIGALALTYLDVEGRICANGWTNNDAKVACKQQDFDYGVAYTHLVENMTQTGGPYWTSEINCTGLERDLLECDHVGLGRVRKCDELHYAGMICYDAEGPSYRIAGGDRDSTWGRVEINLPGFGWGTICNTHWGPKEAQVLCRQFGYDNGEVYKGDYKMPPLHLFVFDVKYMCTGNEHRLMDCPHDAVVPVPSTKEPTTGSGPDSEAKNNTGLVVGVIIASVLVIVLFVTVILVLRWRQSQRRSPRHEQFPNIILHQGHDGSLHLHNPLHGENSADSGPVNIDTSGTVSYKSGNITPFDSQSQYVNTTHGATHDTNESSQIIISGASHNTINDTAHNTNIDTAHNTNIDTIYTNEPCRNDTNGERCDLDYKGREIVTMNNTEPGEAQSDQDSPELSYTKLSFPTEPHIYETCHNSFSKNETPHNDTNGERCDLDNKGREIVTMNNTEPGEAQSDHESLEQSYAKLSFPTEPHIYETCDNASSTDGVI